MKPLLAGAALDIGETRKALEGAASRDPSRREDQRAILSRIRRDRS
jgi:hypothetical protein